MKQSHVAPKTRLRRVPADCAPRAPILLRLLSKTPLWPTGLSLLFQCPPPPPHPRRPSWSQRRQRLSLCFQHGPSRRNLSTGLDHFGMTSNSDPSLRRSLTRKLLRQAGSICDSCLNRCKFSPSHHCFHNMLKLCLAWHDSCLPSRTLYTTVLSRRFGSTYQLHHFRG